MHVKQCRIYIQLRDVAKNVFPSHNSDRKHHHGDGEEYSWLEIELMPFISQNVNGQLLTCTCWSRKSTALKVALGAASAEVFYSPVKCLNEVYGLRLKRFLYSLNGCMRSWRDSFMAPTATLVTTALMLWPPPICVTAWHHSKYNMNESFKICVTW